MLCQARGDGGRRRRAHAHKQEDDQYTHTNSKNAVNTQSLVLPKNAAFSDLYFSFYCGLQRAKLSVVGRTPRARRVHPHVCSMHSSPIAQVCAGAILTATTSYVHGDHNSVLVHIQTETETCSAYLFTAKAHGLTNKGDLQLPPQQIKEK